MRQQLADATSEFIGRRHSLTLRQTPRWAHSFILILIFFGASALASSFIIRIDEVVTVRGRLRPLAGSREVLAPVAATLASVDVRDGEVVRQGTVLARYDTRDAQLRQKNLEEQITLTQRTLTERLALSATQEEVLRRTLRFSKDVADRYKYLEERGAASDLSFLSQNKQYEDVRSELTKLLQERSQTQLETQQRLRSLNSELAQVKLLLANSVITAPIAGTIFDLKKSNTQVTGMGEILMKIVPQDVTKAEVFVSNQDIGFVRLDQPTNVRVDAYPYTKFGELKARVSSIGADVLEPDEKDPSYRFPIQLTLNSSTLTSGDLKLPLKPGMAVQANLKLREKPLVSLITDMFVKNVDGLKSLRD
jgi:hemolysin D